jgi:hypothetical protein
MAIAVYFTFTGLTATSYDECIKRLKKAGAGHPPGRSHHSAFGPPDKLMVYDVWTSQAAFERFGKTLMPILDALSVKPNAPELMPIHKVITPPAKATGRAGKVTRKAKRPVSKKK